MLSRSRCAGSRHTPPPLLLLALLLALALAGCGTAAPVTDTVAELAAEPEPRRGLSRVDDPALDTVMLADAPAWLLVDLAGVRRIASSWGLDASDLDDPLGVEAARWLFEPPLGVPLAELGLRDDALVLLSVYPESATPWLAERFALIDELRDTARPEAERVALVERLLETPEGQLVAGARIFVDALDPEALLGRATFDGVLDLDAAALGLDGVVRAAREDTFVAVMWAREVDGGVLIDLTGHILDATDAATPPDDPAVVDALVRELARVTWPALVPGIPALTRPQSPSVTHLGARHDFLADLVVLTTTISAFSDPTADEIRFNLGNFDGLLALADGAPGHPPDELTVSWGSQAPRTQYLELLSHFATPAPALSQALAVLQPRLPLGAYGALVELNGHLTGKLSTATAALATATPFVQALSASTLWMPGLISTLPWSTPTVIISSAPMWTATLPQIFASPPSSVLVAFPLGATFGEDVLVASTSGTDQAAVEAMTSCLASGPASSAQCHTLAMPPPGEHGSLVRNGETLFYAVYGAATGFVGLVAPSEAQLTALRDARREPVARLMRFCVTPTTLGELSLESPASFQIDHELRPEGIAWRIDLVQADSGRELGCPLR